MITLTSSCQNKTSSSMATDNGFPRCAKCRKTLKRCLYRGCRGKFSPYIMKAFTYDLFRTL